MPSSSPVRSCAEVPRKRAWQTNTQEQADAASLQEQELGFGFDALRENRDAELVSDTDDAGYDRLSSRAAINPSNELHINLDEVWLKLNQKPQSRMAGTEVVDDPCRNHVFDTR